MSAIENVSRRWFLKGMAGAGALVLGAYYAPELLWGQEPADARTDADKATFIPMCLWVSRRTALCGLLLIARRWAP